MRGYQGMQPLLKRLQNRQELCPVLVTALTDETYHMARWTDRQIAQPMDGLALFQITSLMTKITLLTLSILLRSLMLKTQLLQ